MRHENLIYDVGLHKGEDTEYYLAKGFRVVAFEANPDLVSECRTRFAESIATGLLTIVEGAIVDPESEAAKTGRVRFFRNREHSIWGTTDEAWMKRNQLLGASSDTIDVAAIDFGKAMRSHGVPYYLKIDIEGADLLCLEALRAVEGRPEFVSIESEKVCFERLKDEIRLLGELGYSRFLPVQQATVHTQAEPTPAQEGNRVGRIFPPGSSGIFGRDLPGKWMTATDLEDFYKRAFLQYRLFGDRLFLRRFSIGRRAIRLAERAVRRPIPGWYDTHARLG